MYFFMSKVKISLQVVKFPTNLITRLLFFSHHVYPAAARAKTYMYEFHQKPSSSSTPSWVGADHGEDEYYLGLAFLGQDVRGKLEFTKEEKHFSHVMMSYWANFAKFG